MRELQYPFDSNYILRKKRKLKKQLLAEDVKRVPVRIAVLGGSTTVDIVSCLELFLLNEGIEPQIYESGYDKYWEDAIFGNEKLDDLKPEVVFIHTSYRNVKELPDIQDNDLDINKKLETEFTRLKTAWDSLVEKYGCVIIQNNFETPLQGNLGNRDAYDSRGISHFFAMLNEKVYDYAKEHSFFFVHDVAGLAAEYGLRKWQELRYWYMYKYSLTMEAIPMFAYNLSSIVKSLYGKNKKVLVLDADNTLWKGIIGECGAEGIDISVETGIGQSFHEWQMYVKRLQKQGIILTIASKNERESVEAGLKHPDSVLGVEDFAAARINWNDKATNIRELSEELNIGLNQMVFVDDNPAEREIVRQQLREVYVVEGNTPEQFIDILRNSRVFEVTRLTEEDKNRTQMYRENQARREEKNAFADYSEYLKSLNMTAVIERFKPIYYGRIYQLINKTNQFNLTTKRMTEEEVTDIANKENWICLTGKLNDKFGENGIVSILAGEIIDDVLHIRLMLLSCRVFKRDMEYLMINNLFDMCKEQNINAVIGYYYRTEKNNIVKDFYKELGFEQMNDNSDEAVWRIEVEKYVPREVIIRLEES